MSEQTKPPTRPKPPNGLRAAGKRLWGAIMRDLSDDLEFDERDLTTLREACVVADSIEALDAALKRDGEVIDGQRGVRVNPALTEVRQQRLALMRLLAAIDMDDRSVVTPTQRRAQHASNTRWGMQRAAAARRAAALQRNLQAR